MSEGPLIEDTVHDNVRNVGKERIIKKANHLAGIEPNIYGS